MKVLMVLTYYHPHWTGLTAYAKRLAEGLAGMGNQVTVLTSRYEPELADEEIVNGVRVVRLPVFQRVSRGVLMPDFPRRLWRLVQDADVVQMHTPLLEAPIVALAARIQGKPAIFTHHGDLVMPSGAFNQSVERLVTGFMTLALRLTTTVTVHSRDYACHSTFLRPFSDKLESIYPPITIPEPDDRAVENWKMELGLSRQPVIGFAGRWVEEKGFDYLLQAIPYVLQALPNAHFVYAGDTQVVYEDFYTRCSPYLEPVRDHITLLGLIKDQHKLANFYRMCDVFVVPSRTDCFPSVQVEAMLSGTPVVVSDIPGAREPVRVTGMGRVTPSGRPDGIAEAIVDVLCNRPVYFRSREEIERTFDAQQSVGRYEQIMASLTAWGRLSTRDRKQTPALAPSEAGCD